MENNEYQTFIKYLEKENKDKALIFILDLLQQGKSIQNVYKTFLIPAMKDFDCPSQDEEICIWIEHTWTSIIRTILEASYQFVIRDREQSINKKVLVVCPQEEYHEIGAIMTNNYFSLVGFNSYYVGANTPNEDILKALNALKPDYVALSVTNYYNIIITKRLTKLIRETYPNIKIILGGQAFNHLNALEQVEYDYILKTYEDIVRFKNEVVK